MKTEKAHSARCLYRSGWAPFFFVTALGTLAMAVASVGNSVRIREAWAEVRALRAEVEELQATVASMQNTPPKLPPPPQAP